MTHLWAPWRIEYIKSARKIEGCIFCAKSQENDDHNNLIAYRGQHSFIILNYYPYNNGHLMIVPYRHLGEFCALTSEERLEIMNLIDTSIAVLRADMTPQGFNVGANLGAVAGAGIVDHIHFHIVPRWNGDTNFMPVIGNTKVISETLIETCDRLREKFARALKL
jgi:ATP adenylyltransferase